MVKKSKTFRSKKISPYDEFLHKIQQSKMKELWDNKSDEVLEKTVCAEWTFKTDQLIVGAFKSRIYLF